MCPSWPACIPLLLPAVQTSAARPCPPHAGLQQGHAAFSSNHERDRYVGNRWVRVKACSPLQQLSQKPSSATGVVWPWLWVLLSKRYVAGMLAAA